MDSEINDSHSSESAPILRHAVIGTGVLLAAVNFLSPGYSFGYGEQMLLSVKGISWADKNAFVVDWFNNHAPQPHILFDVVTYIGEKLQFLAGIYFLYYLASCFIFALGTALLAEAWLPSRLKYLQHLVNVLVVIGPTFLLGTFLTIHFQAVPNMAGGCLMYFSIACLIVHKDRWAAFAIVATALFHLQHGIGISAIAFLFLLFNLVEKKKLIASAALLSLAISFIIAFNRDLLSGSSEIAHQAAEIGSTGHLNVETWGTTAISTGLFVLLIAVLNFAFSNKSDRRIRLTFVFSIIALGPVIGVISDLNDIEPLQSLARSYFVYRFSMALAPFGCWFIVRLMVRVATDKAWLAACFLPVLIATYFKYLSVTYTNFPQLRSWWILATVVCLATTNRLVLQQTMARMNWSLIPICMLTISSIAMGYSNFGARWPHIDVAPTDNAIIVARSMSTALAKTDVLAADPSIAWIRLNSRRSLVVDCKGVPYGGKPWYEYLRRLKALGVEKPNVCAGFKTLSFDQILSLPKEVGATTVLLLPDDVSYGKAKELLPIRWSSGGSNPWLIFNLVAKN